MSEPHAEGPAEPPRPWPAPHPPAVPPSTGAAEWASPPPGAAEWAPPPAGAQPSAGAGWASPPSSGPPPVPRRRGAERGTVADARFAISLTAALLLLGAVLGVVWAVWTPSGPAAQIFPGGGFLTDETTEGAVAMDGRYLAIAAPVGLLTALAAWAMTRFRGPLVAFALIGGGLLGACAMEVVGGLAGGGSYAGRHFTVSGTAYEVTRTLPLDVHATGLLFVWPALAALVYGMLTAFAVRDDLGRPDPVREALVPASVDPGGQPHGGGGDRDAAGALQQGDLAPQHPRDPY